MDHLVRFSTAGGRPGQHTADSLPEALQFVERLRNSEDVSDVQVFRMQEVPISFRTYYKVEISADGDDSEAAGEDGRGAGQPSAPVGVVPPAISAQSPLRSGAPAAAGNGGVASGALNGHGSSGGEGTAEGGGRRLFNR